MDQVSMNRYRESIETRLSAEIVHKVNYNPVVGLGGLDEPATIGVILVLAGIVGRIDVAIRIGQYLELATLYIQLNLTFYLLRDTESLIGYCIYYLEWASLK